MGKASIGLRAVALAAVMAMALAACGGSSGGGTAARPASRAASRTKGGTLTFLTLADQFQDLDPQRNYTGEDLAFAERLHHPDADALQDQPRRQDGQHADRRTWRPTPAPRRRRDQDWTFTLRDGIKWQDGSAVTCDDVKYGVSRTFATDRHHRRPDATRSSTSTSRTTRTATRSTRARTSPRAHRGAAAFDKAVTCDGQQDHVQPEQAGR